MNRLSTLAAAFLATALVTGPSLAYSQLEMGEPVVDTSELETTFWTCDYAAAKHGVDGNAAILCQVATDELKNKRFGGSFERMLDWWNANKAEQHAALDRVSSEFVKGREFEMEFPESI
jgi:hypothetical protein